MRVRVVGEWNGIKCRNVYNYNETDFDCSKIAGTLQQDSGDSHIYM